MAGGTPDLTRVSARLRAAGCVFAEDEARLLVDAARSPDELDVMVARRAGGLPLEHVLGWAEFCGLRVAVEPGVFVPRRRTEFLVGEAVSLAGQWLRARRGGERAGGETAGGAGMGGAGMGGAGMGGAGMGGAGPLVVVDLCCGCGAIGAALASALGESADACLELHAADADPAAVACARRNVAAAGGRVYLGDLYNALPRGLRGRVAILAANVPYVPSGEVGLLPAEAREHEPRAAVDGGPDGLDIARRVAAGARGWLAPGGHLLIETSERQAQRAAAVFDRAGLEARVASSAELSATVVIGVSR